VERGAGARRCPLRSSWPRRPGAGVLSALRPHFDWVKSERPHYELDFEPKVLVNAPRGTGLEEPRRDAERVLRRDEVGRSLGEFVTGYTGKTDDVSSFELTHDRADFHVLSRVLASLGGRQPKRRLALDQTTSASNGRNFLYSDTSRTARLGGFATGWAASFAINRQKHMDDGAYYVLTDWSGSSPVRSHRAVREPATLPGGVRLSPQLSLAVRDALHVGTVA